MPGNLCTAPSIISLLPLSLVIDVTDATLGASGLWIGTRTGAGGIATLTESFFGRSSWLHGQQAYLHLPIYKVHPLLSLDSKLLLPELPDALCWGLPSGETPVFKLRFSNHARHECTISTDLFVSLPHKWELAFLFKSNY